MVFFPMLQIVGYEVGDVLIEMLRLPTLLVSALPHKHSAWDCSVLCLGWRVRRAPSDSLADSQAISWFVVATGVASGSVGLVLGLFFLPVTNPLLLRILFAVFGACLALFIFYRLKVGSSLSNFQRFKKEQSRYPSIRSIHIALPCPFLVF